jgi:hypothetical protein
MMEHNPQTYHMAAIIPVAGQPLDYNMPWDDCLMPIARDYMLIERAVHTAAMSGCNTIWVVMYRESQPLIKKKLGNWVYDPFHVWDKEMPFMHKREVPIYYVAINPKDRKRRDSQAWSVLYGAKVAHRVSIKISKWVVPSRFLVVSPYGIIDESVIEKTRPNFRLNAQEILFTHNGKSFADNTHLPFTFTGDHYNACNRYFKDIYSGCDIDKTFADVFSPINTSDYLRQDAGWFHKVDSWDAYQSFLKSQEAATIARPKYLVTHKWRGFIKDK